MKFRLKNYQDDAVAEVLANLRKCRTWWHADKDRSAFALSAPTAAGKTVIAGGRVRAEIVGRALNPHDLQKGTPLLEDNTELPTAGDTQSIDMIG